MKSRCAAVALVLALVGCSRRDVADTPDLPQAGPSPLAIAPSNEINPRLLRRFQSIVAPAAPTTPAAMERVALGRQLFFDPRLSKDRDLSCTSCHALDRYGVDGTAVSTGRNGAQGTRNAPTVLNAAGQFVQFWDGRAPTVEEQAKGPIENPIEMGLGEPELVARLTGITEYRASFARAFPEDAEAVSLRRVGDALGAFERTLVVRGRWDRYLEGDPGALTAPEKEGLRVFLNTGCMVCHTGPYLGGSMFERIGVVEPWPATTDVGRMGVTGSAADRLMFKVPTLRNVAQTGPYFHDGSVQELGVAVQMMGRHQLGVELSADETASIVTWLNALTADIPSDFAARPRLPGDPPTAAVALSSRSLRGAR